MKDSSAMPALSQITLKYLLNILTGLWSLVGGRELNDGVLDAGAFMYHRSTKLKLLMARLMGLLVKYNLFKS